MACELYSSIRQPQNCIIACTHCCKNSNQYGLAFIVKEGKKGPTRCPSDTERGQGSIPKEKLRKYEARCSAEAITFLTLAVDSFGGWHKVGLKTITRLGRQLARNLGKDEDEVVRHLHQRLGVLIVRNNAAMMANRHLTFAPHKLMATQINLSILCST